MLLAAALAVVAADHAWAGIPWHDTLASAKNASIASERPLLVIFTASWSEASDRFVQSTLATPEVVGVVSACFEAVRLDVDMNPELARRLQVTNMPTALVIDANERLLFRFECSESTADFVAYAARAIQYAAAARQGTQPSPVLSAQSPSPLPRPVSLQTGLLPEGVAQPSRGAVAYGAVPAPSELPAVAAPVGAGSYPTTTVPSPLASPPVTNPKPKTGSASFFESLASTFKRPVPKKPEPEAAAVPPPQVLLPNQPAAAGGYVSAPPGVAGAMPVGLDGCCSVTLVEKGAWVAGNAQWGARHRGRTYLFAGPMEQQAFLAAPDRYAPVLSGDDPVMALDAGRQVPGDRRYGLTYDSRVYLFSSAETLNAFTAAPDKYTRRVAVAENASRLAPDTILR